MNTNQNAKQMFESHKKLSRFFAILTLVSFLNIAINPFVFAEGSSTPIFQQNETAVPTTPSNDAGGGDTAPAQNDSTEPSSLAENSPLSAQEAEPEVEPFHYDAVEARSFEYAHDLLSQDGIATAVVVSSLTSDNMRELLSLKKEVGILVLKGQIVLFTSSDGNMVRTVKSLNDLINQASFMAHTQTILGGGRQDGPSAYDVFAATDMMEYVITTKASNPRRRILPALIKQ